MRILLDTSAYSNLLRGNKDVQEIIVSSEVILMSVFVLGELYAGFLGGNNSEKNLAILSKFLSKPSVIELHTTFETSRRFGQIKQQLKASGTPIPAVDIWIAAHSMESKSQLITFDKHFERIPGLHIHKF